MELAFLDRIFRLIIWVDASAEYTDEFLDSSSVRLSDDVAIHGEVFLEEPNFIVHIGE